MTDTGDAGPTTLAATLDRFADRRVFLLGEHHDNMAHHRWELQTLAAVLGRRSRIVIALEMFPRSSQAALDQWSAGTLSERAFLERSRWRQVWRYAPDLYLPVFRFARMQRMPMVGINVDASVTRDVDRQGFANVRALALLGITPPAPAAAAYRDYLFESFSRHGTPNGEAGMNLRDSPAFVRFVESQQTWDRVMAFGIRDALARHPDATVVAIMGSGHVLNGWGVEAQLRDLGVSDVVSMLPSDAVPDCAAVATRPAAVVFGLPPDAEADARDRPRLGVWLEQTDAGVVVKEVGKGSVAEATGLRAGDTLVQIGGAACRGIDDAVERIGREPFGSWLPIRVRRGNAELELVARFPPEAPLEESSR